MVIVIVNIILLVEDYHSNYHTDLMVLDHVGNRTRLGRVDTGRGILFL